ncbi:hypothetical protein P692DRAFT_20228375 [Suillus brevipes Sb2]|nr:hypothetical protein P692DRAFT_20228375 [Suillus brevipes Sb2]
MIYLRSQCVQRYAHNGHQHVQFLDAVSYVFNRYNSSTRMYLLVAGCSPMHSAFCVTRVGVILY